MPPKKAKGKKKGVKKAGKKPLIDGVPVADMTREQLINHVIKVREELEREREERNFYQMERDKINMFWEITKEELSECKAQIQSKDIELEEAKNRHDVEINLYRQKSKYIMVESEKNISAQYANVLQTLEKAKEIHQKEQLVLIQQKRELEEKLNNQYISHMELRKDMEKKYIAAVDAIKKECNDEVNVLKQQQEHQLQEIKSSLETQKIKEITQNEEAKNVYINQLMSDHDKAFSGMKKYYNDITVNNIAIINALKKQLDTLQKNATHFESQLSEKVKEKQRLESELKDAREELSKLCPKISHYEQIKILLAQNRNEVKRIKKELEEIKVENDVLHLKCSRLEKAKKEIYDNFVSSIRETQQKTEMRSMFLERKMAVLKNALEVKTAQVSELLRKFNIHTDVEDSVFEHVDNVLREKDNLIEELEHEVAKLTKSQVEMMGRYEKMLKEHHLQF